ncbi:hypothetical protein [Streptomyces sp. NPDC048639]|uniref:hypothetical protein n=1 Tax=Streptomyces sp. NPDC048639 TaxID=3365581 RepID=UPI00370FFDD4
MTVRGAQGRGGPGGTEREGGIPDGLLVGVLAFLLGLTVLVWTATGISGLLAHGSWPHGVHFARTPMAMRELAAQPHDLAAAWPGTPADQLSGYGLFWGFFLGELMVLLVLAIFVIGTVARWRAVRRAAASGKAAAGVAADQRAAAADGGAGAYDPRRPVGAAYTPAAYAPPSDTATATARPAVDPAGAAVPAAPSPSTAAGAAQPVEAAQPLPAGLTESAAPNGTAGPQQPQSVAGFVPTPTQTAESVPPSAASTASAPVASASTASAPVAAPVASAPVASGPTVPGQRALTGVHFTGPDPASRRELALGAIRSAEGPVLVTTSDPTVWAETKDTRAKLGPVHLYDPSHLLDTPARLRWSPSAGCESRDTAASRAAALLAPVRPLNSLDSAMADAAETLLRCCLHAAAVDGRAFRQVHRWASGSAAQDAVRILRTHPQATSGTAGELEATLTAYPERREAAQQLTARALSALSSIHIRDACNPTRADSLALESFIAEGGTLYVVGEAIEDPRTRPGAMALPTALVSSVVEHGRRMAARSSAGRLDPPLTLVLDDIAAVAPFPQLPDLLAEGAAQGMPSLALLRSEEQARARWPHRTLAPGG